MSRYRWGRTSLARIRTVDPDLQRWAHALIEHPALPFDLTIPRHGGARTHEEQLALVEAEVSQTLDSRHVPSVVGDPGKALDVIPYVNGRPDPATWSRFRLLGTLGLHVAAELGLPLVWGGHWDGLPDGAHWELSRYVRP